MFNITRQEFLRQYWDYYIILEKRFCAILDYVSLDHSNYSTFSNEFALQLQAIGAELDNLFKLYCGFRPEDRKSIADYRRYIDGHYPGVVSQAIRIPRYKQTIIPFDGWNAQKPAQSLEWWDAYEKLKHSRTYNREKANLKNTLFMLAALFLLERKTLQEIVVGDGSKIPEESDFPDVASDLFSTAHTGWETKYIVRSLGAQLRNRTDV